MFASISSAVLIGAQGYPVRVEAHVGKGLPGFSIGGLLDESVREARDRTRAAILSIGLQFPTIKVTLNLAPSDQPKSGSAMDLAIAIGILAASGAVPPESVEELSFIGELGLDGSLRPAPGVAPMVGALGDRGVVVPVGSAIEARVAASLLLITGLALGDVALALARLERDGWIIENGGWFEVVDEWADLT